VPEYFQICPNLFQVAPLPISDFPLIFLPVTYRYGSILHDNGYPENIINSSISEEVTQFKKNQKKNHKISRLLTTYLDWQLACIRDQNKIGFCGEPAFIQPIRASNLKSIQRALIGWKKAGPQKKPLLF